MDKDSKLWESIIFTILLPVMSVGCSMALNYLENKIGIWVSIIVLLIIIIMFFVSLYLGVIIFFYIEKNGLETSVALEIKAMQEQISERKIMNGICKEEQLALMERTGNFEEIWLISPDLLTEINSGIYAGIISKNLKKGTKYKYFVPDTEINRVRVNIFKTCCENNRNLEVYYLADDFFFLVPHVDFAIYEPMKSITDGKKGYIGLPILGTTENFAVLMNNDFVDAVVGKLAERINKL